MLRLPNVTLIAVETLVHELAHATILDCVGKVDFGEVLIYTDQPEKLAIPGARVHSVPNWSHKDQYMHFFHCNACDPVKTDYVLFLEWDAGLCDATMWREEFLQFDYLGAPWWYTDGDGKPLPAPFNVGNGGFSLRTMRLMKFVKEKQQRYPAISDNQLCREYGPQIIKEGNFNWAPIEMANDFAFEGFDRLGLANTLLHFGFHSTINWRLILNEDELVRRSKLMKQHKYCEGRLAELMRCLPTWMQNEIMQG